MGDFKQILRKLPPNIKIKTPSYQKDRLERYLAWYDRHLKPPPAAAGPAPEATSLLGQPLVPPALPAEQKKALEASLAQAQAAFAKDPDDADNILVLGRRTAALGRYREAIAIFSRGTAKYPEDVRFLPHRGHRYLTVRELDRALADLQQAAQLITSRNLPDAVEPDTQPNPRRPPAATTHYNVYYHLALAHYLKSDYAAAEKAWRECLQFQNGRGNPEVPHGKRGGLEQVASGASRSCVVARAGTMMWGDEFAESIEAVGRIGLTVFFVMALSLPRDGLVFHWFPYGKTMALAIFILASLTDWWDGWLARRYKLRRILGR